MPITESHLELVAPVRAENGPPPAVADDTGDLGLTATIFAVSLVPVACAAAGIGEWGGGTLGLGTAGCLFAGRELWHRLVADRRVRRSSGR